MQFGGNVIFFSFLEIAYVETCGKSFTNLLNDLFMCTLGEGKTMVQGRLK